MIGRTVVRFRDARRPTEFDTKDVEDIRFLEGVLRIVLRNGAGVYSWPTEVVFEVVSLP